MIRIYYRIKKKKHRDLINLLHFVAELFAGVSLAMGDNLVAGSFHVSRKYFSFELQYDIQNSRARLMGRKISFIESEIRKYVTTYGNSRQLFVRMTDKQIRDLDKS